MRLSSPRPRTPRRGLTLVEMLVAVALLVLMMTIIVTIFAAATGAISTARTFQELDGRLRQVDSVIRTDLTGLTARTTPPLDPNQNLGYLEYGENQPADLQGEDSDDYLKFTAKAPEGQLFTGRMVLNPSPIVFFDKMTAAQLVAYGNQQPITIASQYAEIIYFLRNGNLYRRVLLIAPERQSEVIVGPTTSTGTAAGLTFGGVSVSWQGMNDLSARPNPNPSASSVPVLNTLGDLTNRQNRAFSPRFSDDYFSLTTGKVGSDGIADDTNLDSVPDYYPTLYPGVLALTNASGTNPMYSANTSGVTWNGGTTLDSMAFPYIFPGAYSVLDSLRSSTTTGALHGLLPDGQFLNAGVAQPSPFALSPSSPYGLYYTGVAAPNINLAESVTRGTATGAVAPRPNHSPLDVGDSLTIPGAAAQLQTWWGFPTWRETMSSAWVDPVWALNANAGSQATGLSLVTLTALPPMTASPDLQPFNDAAGSSTFAMPATIYRDDVLMTNVRSFDVKAYDNMVPGYVDLGYSDITAGFGPTVNANYKAFPDTSATPPPTFVAAQAVLQSFGHEGRIPPLLEDYRVDPNSPLAYPNNIIGDDTSTGPRLRRVFDTWSTAYTRAPVEGTPGGVPTGPSFGVSPPYYPSFPPPYPIGLRGLQIQIRVTDPASRNVKVLTIRQDFSDKL